MNHDDDEHDDLWELLGKAKQPEVSPFFARNVLRSIREEQAEQGETATNPRAAWRGLRLWIQRHFATTAVAAATVGLAVVGALMTPTPSNPSATGADQAVAVAEVDPVDEAAREVVASSDLIVIEDLDTLLASEDNDLWLSASLH